MFLEGEFVMRNNIEQFRKEIKEYDVESIKGGYFDKWKYKYLQERLNSEILANRLYHCKNDNNKLKKQYIDVIKFLAHDPQDKLHIRRTLDITWDLDVTIATLISDYLKKFKEQHTGTPGHIYENFYHDEKKAREEWNKQLDYMIEAFNLLKDTMEYDRTDEQKETIKKGTKYFVEEFESLWI